MFGKKIDKNGAQYGGWKLISGIGVEVKYKQRKNERLCKTEKY